MTKAGQHRARSAEIQNTLREHERELEHTLEEIRDSVSSRELFAELGRRARASGYPQAVGRAVRDNPLPSVFAGICAAWLLKSARDAVQAERHQRQLTGEHEREHEASEERARIAATAEREYPAPAG